MDKVNQSKLYIEELWDRCDKLKDTMDPAEYKCVVSGLIFLKYISDKFEARYAELLMEEREEKLHPGEITEDRDEYTAKNIFWIPMSARWSQIVKKAKIPEIGIFINEAMLDIEHNNKQLKNMLYKVFASPNLDKGKLGELIDIIGNIKSQNNKNENILGEVYEFFLKKFANSEGKKGGEYYTPKSIVETIVACINPIKGRLYDPACGIGGFFIHSKKNSEKKHSKIGDLSIYGQEIKTNTWKLCMMNLAIRGIEVNLGKEPADTFTKDQHSKKNMDYIMLDPKFNDDNYWHSSLNGDKRWEYGKPPKNNANFAWIQHVLYHLKRSGVAGVVMPNGSLSSDASNEGIIRKAMIKDDVIDCIIALPNKLFKSSIPACIWILNRNKNNPKHKNRTGKTLFIDTRSMGTMIDRKFKEFKEDDIKRIADTYHAWRNIDEEYEDEKGYCKSAKLEEIAKHNYILTPGRYVGIAEEEGDGIPFEEKMVSLTETLLEQFKKSLELEEEIKINLEFLGFKKSNIKI